MIEPAAPRQLGRGRPRSPAETLRALADELPPDASPDTYGAGPLVEELEAEVAALLGKQAAVFCLSGKAAQLAALRVHADARGRRGRGPPPLARRRGRDATRSARSTACGWRGSER